MNQEALYKKISAVTNHIFSKTQPATKEQIEAWVDALENGVPEITRSYQILQEAFNKIDKL